MTFSQVPGRTGEHWYVATAVNKRAALAEIDTFRLAALVATGLAVLLGVLLLGIAILRLMRPIRELERAMQELSKEEGDLTQRLVVGKDEFATVATGFNLFVERIHVSMTEVRATTQQVNCVTQQLLSASDNSLRNSEMQADRTTTIAAAVTELGATAQDIAGNAAGAAQTASEANNQAAQGRHVVEQSISCIDALCTRIEASCAHITALSSKSENIGRILEVIKGISEQTNLLALNAAIEAALAG